MDDLEEAIEKFMDENGHINRLNNGYGIHKSVAVMGDNFDDGDIHIAHSDSVVSIDSETFDIDGEDVYVFAEDVLGAIKEKREPDFDYAEYVEELVSTANTVSTCDTYIGQNYDVEVKYEGSMFGSGEMGNLQSDPATTIGKIKVSDGALYMGVNVDEDSATDE